MAFHWTGWFLYFNEWMVCVVSVDLMFWGVSLRINGLKRLGCSNRLCGLGYFNIVFQWCVSAFCVVWCVSTD